MRFSLLTVSALALIAMAEPASAGTIFTDRAAFQAAITNASTTTFNDIASDIAVGSGNTVSGYTFTGATSSQSLIDAPPFQYNPVNGVDGTTYFNLGGLGNGEIFSIGLGSAFGAFGFDTHNYDIDGERSEIFIGSQSLGFTPQGRGGVGFLGFIGGTGETFSTVMIVGRGGGVFNGFDNFTTGSVILAAVPEPASWVMMLFGFGAIGSAIRRRKSRFGKKLAFA